MVVLAAVFPAGPLVAVGLVFGPGFVATAVFVFAPALAAEAVGFFAAAVEAARAKKGLSWMVRWRMARERKWVGVVRVESN